MVSFQEFWDEIKSRVDSALDSEIDESRVRMDVIIGDVVKYFLEKDGNIEIVKGPDGNKLRRKSP